MKAAQFTTAITATPEVPFRNILKRKKWSGKWISGTCADSEGNAFTIGFWLQISEISRKSKVTLQFPMRFAESFEGKRCCIHSYELAGSISLEIILIRLWDNVVIWELRVKDTRFLGKLIGDVYTGVGDLTAKMQ